jgi:hypothetical protein
MDPTGSERLRGDARPDPALTNGFTGSERLRGDEPDLEPSKRQRSPLVNSQGPWTPSQGRRRAISAPALAVVRRW